MSFTTVNPDSVKPNSGNFSARIKSETHFIDGIGNITMPGLLTLGSFNLDLTTYSATIEGGTPFSYRPKKLKGFYKYKTSSYDEALIKVDLKKWDGNESVKIGSGTLSISDTTYEWNQFEVLIEWYYSYTPDTLNIVIMSSSFHISGCHESTLWIDNIYFDYTPQSITTPQLTDLSLGNFPNPFTDYTNIFFNAQEKGNYELVITNIIGVEVYRQTIQAEKGENNFVFQNNSLSEGIYMYHISNGYLRETKAMIVGH